MTQAAPVKAARRDLTIYDLEKQQTGPVWVINNTEGPQRGLVTFQVALVNGVGADNLVIPPTWLPIDLMQKVGSRSQLSNSSQFKRCLDPTVTESGRPMLRIITDEEAQELLAQPGAAEEIEELRKKDNVAYSIENRKVQVVRHHEGQKQAEAAATVEPTGPSPRVVQLMDQLSKGQTAEMSVLNSLRSMGNMTQADSQYVLDKADKGQVHLINFAKGRLKP